VTTNADLSFGATLPQKLDVTTGEWSTVSAKVLGTAARTRVTLAPGDGKLFRAGKPVSAGGLGPAVMFGRIRGGAGFLHVVDSGGVTYQVGGAGWGQCPANYTNVGRSFHPSGFWLCARSDLATRRFFVGNVVANAGSSFHVQNGSTVSEGPAGWSECRGASRLLGQFVDANGFWVCMDDTRGVASLDESGSARRNRCPAGFKPDGVDLQSKGSWLCARSDLIYPSFHVATGSSMCGDGSRHIGQHVVSNGSWSCITGGAPTSTTCSRSPTSSTPTGACTSRARAGRSRSRAGRASTGTWSRAWAIPTSTRSTPPSTRSRRCTTSSGSAPASPQSAPSSAASRWAR
jgi:hypothetical protein